MNSDHYISLGELIIPNRPITYGIVQPGPNVEPDGIPLIRGKDYSSGLVATEGLYHVLPEIDKPYSRSKVRGGDILLSIVGYVGQVAIVPEELTGANITQTTARLSIDPDKALYKFIFHSLRSNFFGAEVRRYEKGSAQPGLNLGDLHKFRLCFTSNLELQSKITEILDALDQTIQKTQSLIDKYQQIKAGLMHDLFTRGVTADGKLRPTREEVPELYQETAIGWIPREWGCEPLGQLIQSPPKNGFSPREVDSWQGLYVLGLGCLTKGGFEPIQLKRAPIFAKSTGAILEDGDFLISRANTPALVGLCGIYRDIGEDAIYPDLMMRIRPSSILDAHYLECYMLSEAVRIRLTALAVGTSQSMVKLNAESVKNFLVALPLIEEQKLIVERYKPIESKIRILRENKDKLESQKNGLMHDLLTGKVQVPFDQTEEEAVCA